MNNSDVAGCQFGTCTRLGYAQTIAPCDVLFGLSRERAGSAWRKRSLALSDRAL